jgi:hypothetical protein
MREILQYSGMLSFQPRLVLVGVYHVTAVNKNPADQWQLYGRNAAAIHGAVFPLYAGSEYIKD